MADWLIEGLTATISGVLTVFIVLILIAFLISQLKHLNKIDVWVNRNRQRNSIESTSSILVTPVEQVEDDLELVAVITAAVASSLNTTSDQLIVRSIRRVEHKSRRR